MAEKGAYALWLNQRGWDIEAAMGIAAEFVDSPDGPPPGMEPGWFDASLPAFEEWMYQRYVVHFQWDLFRKHVTEPQPWERWLDPPLIELAEDIGERCAAAALEQRTWALLR
jgi:hypothetical protein